MAVRRIVPYADGSDIAASKDFYVEALGLEVGMEDPVLGLTSPANPKAQVIIPSPGMEDPQPRFGVDVGDPTAVDAAHEEAVKRGLRIVYPLTDEPWGFAASSSRTPAARSSMCSPTLADREGRASHRAAVLSGSAGEWSCGSLQL